MAIASTIIGALGAAGSAAASAFGLSKSAEEDKKREKRLLALQSDIDTEYYQDALENTGSRAYLKRLDEQRDKALSAINNDSVASGATQENVLAAKQKVNESENNAISTLIQQNETNKRGYFANKYNIQNQLGQLDAQRAQNWATIAGNISQGIGNLASVYLDGNGEKLVGDKEPIKVDSLEKKDIGKEKGLESIDNKAKNNFVASASNVADATYSSDEEEKRRRALRNQFGETGITV